MKFFKDMQSKSKSPVTGGQAFPSYIYEPSAGGGFTWTQSNPGMSLRDYFAAAAIPTLTQRFSNRTSDDWTSTVANMAYLLADAMIAQRSKPNDA